ncbi:hypothetical protein [Aquitalea pelogenes]|nr:hypothetical protein [Aquitalea pelogenes]
MQQWLSWQWTRNGWMAFGLYLLLGFAGLKLGLPVFANCCCLPCCSAG